MSATNKILYGNIDSYDFAPRGYDVLNSGTTFSAFSGNWFKLQPTFNNFNANGVTISASTEAFSAKALSSVTITDTVFGNFTQVVVSGPGSIIAYRL